MRQAIHKLFLFFFVSLSATQSNENLMYKFTPSQKFTVKCLLLQDTEGVLIETKGPYKVINLKDNKILSHGYFGKRYFAQCSSIGISWGENYIGSHKIKIEPTKKSSSILINGIEHKGAVYLYQVNGRLSCINECSLTKFLEHQLSSEVELNSLHSTTLETLAIVARTNLHYQLLHNSNPYYDVKLDNDLHSAAYHKKISQAIEDTASLVLNYQGIPFPTSFTRNCSGNTASFSAIFRQQSPAPEGVFVSYAKKMQNSSLWNYAITKETLAKLCHSSKINSIKLFVDPPSQKVYALRILTNNSEKDISFFKLQEMLGKENLKSNSFSVTSKDNKLIFSGTGEGHGVGLCLLSANKMAQNGNSAPQILKYFYPDTSLTKSEGFSPDYKKAFEKQLIKTIESK